MVIFGLAGRYHMTQKDLRKTGDTSVFYLFIKKNGLIFTGPLLELKEQKFTPKKKEWYKCLVHMFSANYWRANIF